MSSIKANSDFLNEANIKSEKEQYALYYSLDSNKRKSLDATNYWRVMNGLKEIPVPSSDTEYHKYFDKRCYELAESFQIMKNGAIEFRKKLVSPNKLKEVQKVEVIEKVEIKTEVKTEIKKTEVPKEPPKQIIEKKEVFVPKVQNKKQDTNQQQASLF